MTELFKVNSLDDLDSENEIVVGSNSTLAFNLILCLLKPFSRGFSSSAFSSQKKKSFKITQRKKKRMKASGKEIKKK